MPPDMSACDDLRSVFAKTIVHRIWEAANEGAPNVAIDDREGCWILSDVCKDDVDRSDKLWT
jgi:hypothetical protein